MHLQIVAAFALLLWWPLDTDRPFRVNDLVYGQLIFWGVPGVICVASAVLAYFTNRRLRGQRNPGQVLGVYHRVSLLLRLLLLAATAATLWLTTVPDWLTQRAWLAVLPGLPQLAALVPFLLGHAVIWWLVYPIEQGVREPMRRGGPRARWQFVVFNFRHQVLILALPLATIVITFAVTRSYRAALTRWSGSAWTADAVVGTVAALLFVISPILLKRIWATSPLPDGPLRDKLLAVCARINLRVRDILIWHSDGMMVNAAVMGLFPRVRYILLSDSLLESMTDAEIEAVFGHEAGHVRCHHIPFFLLFAFASMLVVSGVMEGLTRLGQASPRWALSDNTIQVISLLSAAPLWGLAFGWISRRFERQADVHGAMCVALNHDGAGCATACIVHEPPARRASDFVCSSGARVFAGALRKVALLNGIPPRERSWRHSSIASRIHFLTALAGDPKMVLRFTRTIRRIKWTLLLACVGGSVVAAAYIWQQPGYRRQIKRSLFEPLRQWVAGPGSATARQEAASPAHARASD